MENYQIKSKLDAYVTCLMSERKYDAFQQVEYTGLQRFTPDIVAICLQGKMG